MLELVPGRSALFFDLGGTLTTASSRQQITVAAVKAANDAGHLVVIVSNQKAIAEGRLTMAELDAIRSTANEVLDAAGAHVDGWYFCCHAPTDGCTCRKPAAGLLLTASSDLDIDLRASAIVGDRDDRDVAAGRSVGTLTALLEADERSRRAGFEPDLADQSLTRLVHAVLEHLAST